METSLVLDSSSKHLGLQFKKRFEHSSDVQVGLGVKLGQRRWHQQLDDRWRSAGMAPNAGLTTAVALHCAAEGQGCS